MPELWAFQEKGCQWPFPNSNGVNIGLLTSLGSSLLASGQQPPLLKGWQPPSLLKAKALRLCLQVAFKLGYLRGDQFRTSFLWPATVQLKRADPLTFSTRPMVQTENLIQCVFQLLMAFCCFGRFQRCVVPRSQSAPLKTVIWNHSRDSITRIADNSLRSRTVDCPVHRIHWHDLIFVCCTCLISDSTCWFAFWCTVFRCMRRVYGRQEHCHGLTPRPFSWSNQDSELWLIQEDQESFTKKYEPNTADTHTVHIQKAV